jgi:hypothetical protein
MPNPSKLAMALRLMIHSISRLPLESAKMSILGLPVNKNMVSLESVKTFIKTADIIRKAFENLKDSRLFAKKIGVSDLVEKYFALDSLPEGRLIVQGRLSNYTLSNHIPIYTPAHLKAVREVKSQEFSIEQGRFVDKISLELRAKGLSVPSISHKAVEMKDRSHAKILWLYPETCNGLVFEAAANKGLIRNDLCDVFKIGPNEKPIPILVDTGLTNIILHKTVEITGIPTVAPIEFFEQFANGTDNFVLDYFSNCFRPLSTREGVFAIDARKPAGRIRLMREEGGPFKIIYTVQGLIEIPDISLGDRLSEEIMTECIDAIPDRQGLGPARFFGDESNESFSIASIGNTVWQKPGDNSGIAAFTEIDLLDAAYSQASLTELVNNWQVWQKNARQRIRTKFGFEPKIRPFFCSNSDHDKSFHPNGLRVPNSLERQMLDENPEIRKSIDWLGISVGKVTKS